MKQIFWKLNMVVWGTLFVVSLFTGCTKKPKCHYEIVRLDLDKFEPVYADICN